MSGSRNFVIYQELNQFLTPYKSQLHSWLILESLKKCVSLSDNYFSVISLPLYNKIFYSNWTYTRGGDDPLPLTILVLERKTFKTCLICWNYIIVITNTTWNGSTVIPHYWFLIPHYLSKFVLFSNYSIVNPLPYSKCVFFFLQIISF